MRPQPPDANVSTLSNPLSPGGRLGLGNPSSAETPGHGQPASSGSFDSVERRAKGRKLKPMSKERRFNERAPPPSMFLVKRNALDEVDSDADSVVSDYQEEKNADSSGSAPGPPSFAESCASMPGSTPSSMLSLSSKAGLRPTSAKKDDALPSLQSQPGKSLASRAGRGLGSIPGVNAWTSRAGGSQIPVTASSAGEWVSKLKALEEILTVHKQIACNVLEFVVEHIPEAKLLDGPAKKNLLDRMNQDLGASREMLARNAQGLIGSDLAELRLVQAERKKINEKSDRMNKLYLKDSAALRERIKASAEGQALPNRKDEFEPFLFTSPEQRSYVVATLDRKLKAILEAQPEMSSKVDGSEMARLQDLLSRERMTELEKRAAYLTEQHTEALRTVARLEVQKEQLEQELQSVHEQIHRSPSSSSQSSDRLSSGHSVAPVQETDSPKDPRRDARRADVSGSEGGSSAVSMTIQKPAGKPKSGRPKRNSAAGFAASSSTGGNSCNSGSQSQDASQDAYDDSSNDHH
eukprot:TRINITY_DN74834_c0_g1_i1.p1 TRINITY_DN74834_c0_g1~~TRINITY_DN74834_c0_g1_i1.p1  ORF type:complete len:522 (-),score=102.20 TRINITY_DN74834_c0_g1_i1:28-1593(-)